MTSTDPITGAKLPTDALQRSLFDATKVFVYNIPPINSSTFKAASWTANPANQIFTARLRVLETAIPAPSTPSGEKITVAVLLEDPATDNLFAGCPYTHPTSVEQASDSSRFFAVRVVGERGQKATLGIGFEEREDAFHFSDALIKARKILGLDGLRQAGGGGSGKEAENKLMDKKDFSLKEGETITVKIGGKGRRTTGSAQGQQQQNDEQALFSIKPPPPPSGGAVPFLAPPPSAASVKAQQQDKAQDLGFDDGEFGEFQ